MKLVRWKRFTWQLKKLPPLEAKLPPYYVFRPATREDVRAVNQLVFTAFSLDAAWSDTLKIFRERLDLQLDLAFSRESTPGLVVTHGSRIIAASILSTDPESESNLVSGPCILPEYGNRGLGTMLLYDTLRHLRSAGLESAAAVTKENTASCKFVYPKFGSVSATYEFVPEMAES
jgi:predicted N-acetyltransferase YhbS